MKPNCIPDSSRSLSTEFHLNHWTTYSQFTATCYRWDGTYVISIKPLETNQRINQIKPAIIDSQKVKDSNPRPCTTPPLTPKIRTHDHALHHHWPQKDKDLNPRPCTTPPLTPKIRTHDHALHHTIDSKKTKIRTQYHVLRHHWSPLRQRFEPQIMRTASRMKYNSCVDSVSLCRITYRPDYTKWWRRMQNR
jgi:hypothetical protein